MGRPPSADDLLCDPPRRRLPEDGDPPVTLEAALEGRRFVTMVHSIMQAKEDDERGRQNGG